MQFKLSKNYYKYFVTFTENYYTLTTKRVKICCPGKMGHLMFPRFPEKNHKFILV